MAGDRSHPPEDGGAVDGDPLRGMQAALSLAERADAAIAKVVEQARIDIGAIRELMGRKERFFDIGLSLKRLKEGGAARALGHRSFVELCESELEMSGAVATRLVRIVENMSRELAERLGQYQALAVLELCDATPEDDTPDEVATGTLRLPSGKTFEVTSSTVREKKDAAKEIREGAKAREGSRKSGMTTSAEDRRVAAKAEAALQAVGLERAKVRAVARPGRVADLRIEGIPTSELRRAGTVLARRPK
jgi:hypothetical protein